MRVGLAASYWKNEKLTVWSEVELILNRSCDTLDAADEVLEAIYRCAREYEGMSSLCFPVRHGQRRLTKLVGITDF